jgi:hypothetical protein
MGLLTKAAGKAVPELDKMGKVLLDRIRRLPPKKSTPYTALSLLKAYGSFQAGVCFSLWKGNYTSYATVGLGVEKISIPCEKLYSPEISERPFAKLSITAEVSIKLSGEGLCYWAFPLDGEDPWGALILLGDNNNPLFNPGVLRQIIQGASEIFNPQIDKILTRNIETGAPASQSQYLVNISNPLEAAIAQYSKINTQFNGILLDLPAGMAKDKTEEFNKTVYNMVALLGITVVLPSKRSLILIPGPLDKELIAHRLSKSLNTKALMVFKAGSPGEALDFIRSYL